MYEGFESGRVLSKAPKSLSNLCSDEGCEVELSHTETARTEACLTPLQRNMFKVPLVS
jgi:hypothetical protein